MKVEVLQSSDSACDVFVQRHPDAKLCHLYAWAERVVRKGGHSPFYLVARDGDDVYGILPLTQVRSRIFGNRMVSQASSNYGGPLTECPEALDALFEHAVRLATERGCESIEFRNIEPLPYDLQRREDKMCMHLPLKADPEDVWKKFKPKVRNQVRKAEKSGIVAESGDLDMVREFYKVYTVRMHQLGTPPRSRKFICDVLTGFPDNSRIFVVRLDGKAVGAGLTIHYKGFVEIPLAATLTQYNKLCPNNLLYWTVMEYYCKAGAAMFDFGRCTVDSNTYRFKKQWGAEPVKLNYQYWTRPGHELSFLSPDNPKYRKKVEMWKKLPLWLTRLIGPYISRHLG